MNQRGEKNFETSTKVKSQEERRIWKRTQREVMNQRGEKNLETRRRGDESKRKEKREETHQPS